MSDWALLQIKTEVSQNINVRAQVIYIQGVHTFAEQLVQAVLTLVGRDLGQPKLVHLDAILVGGH